MPREGDVQASQKLFELDWLYENAPVGFGLLDTNLRFVRINKRLAAISGKPASAHIGRPLRDVSPDIGKVLEPMFRRVSESGEEVIDAEVQWTTSDEPQKQRCFLVSCHPLESTDGTVYRIGTIVQEITESKLAEQAMLENQIQLRALASELYLAEERERRLIAAELHDRIAQKLALARIKLGGLREFLSSTGDPELLEQVEKLIAETIQDTRSLVFELSPPVLYELGFEPAVEWLAERMQSQHGIVCDVENERSSEPLGDEIRVVLFQAVRELLLNITKHARANRAKVTLRRVDGRIRIRVQDDGSGFDPASIGTATEDSGFGLFSIRERLDLLGGTVQIESAAGQGTQITLTAPLSHAKAKHYGDRYGDENIDRR